jgi:hypothetical protein
MAPVIKLNSGYDMPQVGFGLWKVPNDVCADVVYNAIKTGYRLFDGACGKSWSPLFSLRRTHSASADRGFSCAGFVCYDIVSALPDMEGQGRAIGKFYPAPSSVPIHHPACADGGARILPDPCRLSGFSVPPCKH